MKLKPLLHKWVGNKSTIAKKIVDLFPLDLEYYYEPFMGSGSIFCEMINRGYQIPCIILSDSNFKLINFYRQIQSNDPSFYKEIKSLVYEWSNCDYREKEPFYFEKRKLFNATVRTEDLKPLNAALFYFLNHTCFNGLYRENAKGQFNNPIGYTASRIHNRFNVDWQLLEAWYKALQTVDLKCCDYSRIPYQPSEKTLIYLDPPYSIEPDSKVDAFVSYGAKKWDWQANQTMVNLMADYRLDGTHVVISQPYSEYNMFLFTGWHYNLVDKIRPLTKTKTAVKEVIFF